MAYFPFFADISEKIVLVAGGGKVALRKIEKMLPFNPDIRVIAPEICDQIKKIPNIQIFCRTFQDEDLETADIVIAATGKRNVNDHIYSLCREKKIPVNTADNKNQCSFLFPALVRRGNLVVGISTGGGSPSAAVYVKNKIDECLPENLEEILNFLQASRKEIKETIPNEEMRKHILQNLFFDCLQKGRPLNEQEMNEKLLSADRSIQ